MNWSELTNTVGWDKTNPPAPPTVAQINAALKADNRYQIMEWWQRCQVGTVNGAVGQALRHAAREVYLRCTAEPREEEVAHGQVEQSQARIT